MYLLTFPALLALSLLIVLVHIPSFALSHSVHVSVDVQIDGEPIQTPEPADKHQPKPSAVHHDTASISSIPSSAHFLIEEFSESASDSAEFDSAQSSAAASAAQKAKRFLSLIFSDIGAKLPDDLREIQPEQLRAVVSNGNSDILRCKGFLRSGSAVETFDGLCLPSEACARSVPLNDSLSSDSERCSVSVDPYALQCCLPEKDDLKLLPQTSDEILEKFLRFGSANRKRYRAAEFHRRLAAFTGNIKRIHQHNRSDRSKYFTLAVTSRSDLSLEESFIPVEQMKQYYIPENKRKGFLKRVRTPSTTGSTMRHLLQVSPSSNSASAKKKTDFEAWVPEPDVDLRKTGVLTPVKNQGSCGSCFAFSALAVVESWVAYRDNPRNPKPVSLSVQNYLSCSSKNDQCWNGGDMSKAIAWIAQNGACAESDVPYTAGQATTFKAFDEKCNCARAVSPWAPSGLGAYLGARQLRGESEMEQVLRTGRPVGFCMIVDQSMNNWGDGIYVPNPKLPTGGHNMVAVGFGRDAKRNLDYWIVKNSWGTQWGNAGYFRIIRNAGVIGSRCIGIPDLDVAKEGPQCKFGKVEGVGMCMRSTQCRNKSPMNQQFNRPECADDSGLLRICCAEPAEVQKAYKSGGLMQ